MNNECAKRRRTDKLRGLVKLAAALLIAASAGCANSPGPANTLPPPVDLSGEYVIGVPDLLNVTVWQQPDLSGAVRVRRDGRISIPLLGEVQAAGLTPSELGQEIRSGLETYVANPRVDVAVTEMRSQVVSVIGGGIEKSGVVELRKDMRIIDALAEMGGLTPFAKKRRIQVIRVTPEGNRTYRFDYQAFVDGEAPQTNFLLAPGDTIVVPE